MSRSPDERRTTQRQMPAAARQAHPREQVQEQVSGEPCSGGREYDVFPECRMQALRVGVGLGNLVAAIGATLESGVEAVAVDGTAAVDWDAVCVAFTDGWGAVGVPVQVVDTRERMRPAAEIEAMLEPWLGGDDPIFGRRCELELADWFANDEGATDSIGTVTRVWCGPGAALLAPEGARLVYMDLPKNEEQFAARAGRVRNLGAKETASPKAMYKRSYFVDWPVQRRHITELLPRVDWYVDVQNAEPTWVRGDELRSSLERMSRGVFRPRPWFEPGPWGGQWLKPRVAEACQGEVPNIAWSFELISPENGLVLSDGRLRCEVSMDLLMAANGEQVLGFGQEFFGAEFPIRFDFLDTMEGGNLSVQVHPQPDYIRHEFGELFTQDETYYILDADHQGFVWLGLQEGVDPVEFRATLEQSEQEAVEVDVERFVQRHPASKHDLFLIPHGTIHSAGRGNLVLEISATPYIFTFKCYDWLRMDLEGKPRPLNIARAWDNLDWERQGERVREELLSRPEVEARGQGWQRERLPTHAQHFYSLDRYTLAQGTQLEIPTQGSPQVCMVVEGAAIEVSCERPASEPAETPQRYAYAETFVVGAAAQSYIVGNMGDQAVQLLVSSLKPRHQWPAWMKELG